MCTLPNFIKIKQFYYELAFPERNHNEKMYIFSLWNVKVLNRIRNYST